MGSSRLPGKVLLRASGSTMLEILVKRMRRTRTLSRIIVATTTSPADQQIVDHCQEIGVEVMRGSEADVLSRYWEAARQTGAEVIARITADCPLLDPAFVDAMAQYFHEHRGELDYLTTGVDTWPIGIGLEIFTFRALEEAYERSTLPEDREHVTTYIKRHPERYRLGKYSSATPLNHHRWTLDTPEDFRLIRHFLECLLPANPGFTISDCLTLVQAHPEWSAINSPVQTRSAG